MNCWWCGIEPIGVYEVRVMESASAVRLIVQWPDGDHPHSEEPPSADEMAEQAYRMLNQRVS
jgi:hypothetical protein